MIYELRINQSVDINTFLSNSPLIFFFNFTGFFTGLHNFYMIGIDFPFIQCPLLKNRYNITGNFVGVTRPEVYYIELLVGE